MKKLLAITNHSYMFWQFRRELMEELQKDYEVAVSTPFVGHEKDLSDMGLRMIQTEVNRRSINPRTDLKLLMTYYRLLKEEKPDMVITYSIKPNIYAGLACRRLKIPYCVNVQGLGTAFQKPSLASVVSLLYRSACKRAKAVFFENAGTRRNSSTGESCPSRRSRCSPAPASTWTIIPMPIIRSMRKSASCTSEES